MNDSFDFYVTGIEEGMTAVLATAFAGELGYASAVRPYRGELDLEELGRESKAALSDLVSHLPLYLVSYVDGASRPDTDDLLLPGEAVTFEHDATFTVVCCAGGWRGDDGAVGVSKMVGDALSVLSGRMFTATVEGEEGEEVVSLNLTPLKPSPESPNPAFIVRLHELTVYAVYFDAMFKFTVTPAADAPVVIDTINFNIDLRNRRGNREGMPGVQVHE